MIKHLATASKSKHGLLACGQKFMSMSPAPVPIASKALEILRAQDRKMRSDLYNVGKSFPPAPPPYKAGEFVLHNRKVVLTQAPPGANSAKRKGCKDFELRPTKRIRGKSSISNIEYVIEAVKHGSSRMSNDECLGIVSKKPRTS